jgi:hypothetical protein
MIIARDSSYPISVDRCATYALGLWYSHKLHESPGYQSNTKYTEILRT